MFFSFFSFLFIIFHNYSLLTNYFPAFLPSFNLITSSIYLIPLPLYGSGFLNTLILAAISQTNCLSIPSTLINGTPFGHLSTVKVIHLGASYSTG
jgi:hypothetical protein